MNSKNKIKTEPLFASEEQKAKGFCEESWFFISASSDDETKVYYFNPSIDKEEYQDFKEFVESNMEDFCCPGDTDKPNKTIKDNYATISNYSGTMEEDFNEDSRKTFKVAVGKAAIMEFHKGGVSEEKLDEIVKNIHKDLGNLESEGAHVAAESHEYHKDPYAYYGVSKKDFF
jgi:hypothetical protein